MSMPRTTAAGQEPIFLLQPPKVGRAAALMSSILRDATLQVWGRAFSIQAYRQLSIAVTEKHVREACRPTNVRRQ